MPSMAPFRKMFSRPVSSGWNPVPTSRMLPTRPRIVAVPLVGGRDPGQDLEQRRLPRAVATDEAHDLALTDLEGDVLEGPDLLRRVVDVLESQGAAGRVRDRVAKRLVARLVLAEEEALRELGAYDGVPHQIVSAKRDSERRK